MLVLGHLAASLASTPELLGLLPPQSDRMSPERARCPLKEKSPPAENHLCKIVLALANVPEVSLNMTFIGSLSSQQSKERGLISSFLPQEGEVQRTRYLV